MLWIYFYNKYDRRKTLVVTAPVTLESYGDPQTDWWVNHYQKIHASYVLLNWVIS